MRVAEDAHIVGKQDGRGLLLVVGFDVKAQSHAPLVIGHRQSFQTSASAGRGFGLEKKRSVERTGPSDEIET